MLIFSNGEVVDTNKEDKIENKSNKKLDKDEKYFRMIFYIGFSALFFFLGTRVHIDEGKFVHSQLNICEEELPRNLECVPDKVIFKISSK